jgi:hypothetical protein
MTAKYKVRQVHPHASHKRYHTHGGEGYSLIWSDSFGTGNRLGSGKTTAEAWKAAWAFVSRPKAVLTPV